MPTDARNNAGESARLFLAFPLSSPLRQYVRSLQGALRNAGVRGRWTRPENLHLTALFLGPQRLRLAPAFLEALRSRLAAVSAFDLPYNALAAFSTKPRLLFLRLADPEGRFAHVCNEVLDVAVREGLDPPANVLKKAPLPHITVVRFRNPHDARKIRTYIDPESKTIRLPALPLPPPEAQFLPCTSLHLYRSDITPDGPIYAHLGSVELAGPTDSPF